MATTVAPAGDLIAAYDGRKPPTAFRNDQYAGHRTCETTEHANKIRQRSRA